MIQDMCMLLKWKPANCIPLLRIEEFHEFLLDLLFKLQLSLFDGELKGAQAAIWELGIKTYTLLMKNAFEVNAENHHYLLKLFVWREIKQRKANRENRTFVTSSYHN